MPKDDSTEGRSVRARDTILLLRPFYCRTINRLSVFSRMRRANGSSSFNVYFPPSIRHVLAKGAQSLGSYGTSSSAFSQIGRCAASKQGCVAEQSTTVARHTWTRKLTAMLKRDNILTGTDCTSSMNNDAVAQSPKPTNAGSPSIVKRVQKLDQGRNDDGSIPIFCHQFSSVEFSPVPLPRAFPAPDRNDAPERARRPRSHHADLLAF